MTPPVFPDGTMPDKAVPTVEVTIPALGYESPAGADTPEDPELAVAVTTMLIVVNA
jgi:hypothetical protein